MVPALGDDTASAAPLLSRRTCELAGGYALLHATEDKARAIRLCEADVLRAYLRERN